MVCAKDRAITPDCQAVFALLINNLQFNEFSCYSLDVRRKTPYLSRMKRLVLTGLFLLHATCASAMEILAQARLDAQQGAAFAVSTPQADSWGWSGRAWLTAWVTPRMAFSAKAHGAWAADETWSGGELNATYALSAIWLTAGAQRIHADSDRNLVFGAVSYRLAADHFASLTAYRDTTLKYTLIEGEADTELPFSRRAAWYLGGRLNYLHDGDFAALYQGEAMFGLLYRVVTTARVTVKALPYLGYMQALSDDAEARIDAGGQSANGGLLGLRLYAWF